MKKKPVLFKVERAVFKKKLKKLLESGEGKWAVVFGEELDAPFDDFEKAIEFAYKKYGLKKQFMVKQILAKEPILFL